MSKRGFEQELAEEYLQACMGVSKCGGYTRLSNSKEEIRNGLLEKHANNGNGKRVARLLRIYQGAVFGFLEPRAGRERFWTWPEKYDGEIRERINTALQST